MMEALRMQLIAENGSVQGLDLPDDLKDGERRLLGDGMAVYFGYI